MKTEYDIHDLIGTYPYILDAEFENLSKKHEKIYSDRSRADFVFSNSNISIVVEVKIGSIDVRTVEQALHYLDMEKKEDPQKKLLGILVGHRIVNREELEEKMRNSGYEFEIKFLDRDIPTEVKLCDNCRKVNNLNMVKCKFCGSSKFIKDPFLFSPHN